MLRANRCYSKLLPLQKRYLSKVGGNQSPQYLTARAPRISPLALANAVSAQNKQAEPVGSNVNASKNPRIIASYPTVTVIPNEKQEKLWTRFFNFIEEVSHMDEVRKAQAYVLDIKNQLRKSSERKRDILRKLDIVHNSLHHIYKDMKYNQNRASDQYLLLMKQEVNLYTEEKDLQDAFKTVDQEEQYLFNKFSEAIADSYEKEKMHTNFVKMLGIIGTILGSFITLIATVIGVLYNQNKFYTLRQEVEDSFTQQMISKLKKIDEHIKTLETKQNQTPSAESWGAYLKRHTRWTYSWALPKN